VSTKAIETLIKTVVALFVLTMATVFWYYTLGRKPKLALSTRFTEKSGEPVAQLIGPGEVLLLLGTKATLYDVASGASKWTADLHATAAAPAAPVAKATPAPAAKPAPVPAAKPAAASAVKAGAKVTAASAPASPPAVAAATEEKTDPLLAKRVERRFAKLQTWAAKLNQKRATLKTPLQVEAFNVEAAKYHAELAEARAEAAPLHRPELSAMAIPATAPVPEVEAFTRQREDFDEEWHRKSCILADGATVWILQGSHAFALDRGTGRIVKDVPLVGDFADAYFGADCLYVAATTPDGGRQIARLTTTDIRVLPAAGPAAHSRFAGGEPGRPAEPNLQPLRTEYRAARSELVQADIRLLERKVTERQIMSGDAVSDMEEADKKTTGGSASDAAIFSQALAKDAVREATGGKERIDESTYEVMLRRPFITGSTASAPVRVQGRPEIFSTATLDLVIAGQTLIAFDHANKKLWESKLAQPISFGDEFEEERAPNALTATTAVPCLEDSDRLYLFDRAFLNTFERATGKLLWRIPSIGIRKVQLDGSGTIYILSSNGTAESLHGYGGNTEPVTMKVDARTGRIAWKLEKYENCFVSGGNLYASRETRNGEDVVNQVFDRSKAPQTRFKLYKLSTRSGEPQWEWFQTRRPLSIESEGKKVSLLFADELQVIKSIAL